MMPAEPLRLTRDQMVEIARKIQSMLGDGYEVHVELFDFGRELAFVAIGPRPGFTRFSLWPPLLGSEHIQLAARMLARGEVA